jgi:protein TonB
MKNKKSKKANLENKKSFFFLVGLIISLGLVLLAFEWKTQTKEIMDLGSVKIIHDDFNYIPSTPNEKIKLPPKPLVLPTFELVNNETEVDVSLDVFDTEIGDDQLFNFDELVFSPGKNEIDKEEEIYVFVEEQPQFPGGERALQQYLANSINYPLIAQENGIQGKVFISFVINENGDISDVTLVRGVDAALDKEALRVIRSLPKWKPGKQGGKAVKVRYNVPINFELH